MRRDTHDTLTEVITHHATQGLELLAQYQEVYAAFYQSPFQLIALVQLCDAYLRYNKSKENTASMVHFCFTYLQNAKVGYPIAGALQDMFRSSLKTYNIPVPDDLEQMIGPSDHFTQEQLMDACTRVSYKAFIPQIKPDRVLEIAKDFAAGWPLLPAEVRAGVEKAGVRVGHSKARSMDIGGMLNP